MLIQRAYMICNQPYLLDCELQHISNVFVEVNGYPIEVVKRTMIRVKRENEREVVQNNTEIASEQPKEVFVVLPYAGTKGELIGREINTTLKSVFKDKIVTNAAYKAKKLSSCFNIKDRSPLIHQHNLVYKYNCADCSSTYIGETARRLEERVLDHNKRDKNSHVLKHRRERNHCDITMNDITVLSKNFKTNEKRKISEALIIRSQKPSLNVQGMSTPLLLFN